MESYTTTGVTICVSAEIAGYRVLAIRKREGKGIVLDRGLGIDVDVVCLHCGNTSTVTAHQIVRRIRGSVDNCNKCPKKHGREVASFRIAPRRRNCRTCDDCTALRPETGCTGCGEFPAQQRRSA